MAEEKLALRRVRRKQADGMNETYYLDANTGKEITLEDLGKYKILDAQGASLDQLGLGKKAKEEASKVEGEESTKESGPGKHDDGGEYYEGVNQQFAGNLEPRTAANNYGYAPEDPILNALAKYPNPIAPTQAGAKLINFARNVNNKYAVAQGRKVLDIEPPKFTDKKLGPGQLGDVTINGKSYPVGYEATEPVKQDSPIRNEIAEFLGNTAGGMVAGPLGGLVGGVAARELIDNAPEKLGRTNLTVEEARRRQSIAADQAKPRGPADGLVGNFFKDADLTDQVDKGETLARGLGLGDLSPSFRTGVRYSHANTRGPVETGLTPRSIESMQTLAEGTPGGINVTSAYRSPSVNAAVGGARASLHKTGDAYDISTAGLSDLEKRNLVERAVMSGGMELGTYPDQSIHVGTIQRTTPAYLDPAFSKYSPPSTGGVSAMFQRTRNPEVYANAPDWFRDGLEVSRLAPTPEPRPTGFAAAPSSATVIDRPTAQATVDLNRASYFDTDTRRLMAATIAGEIDPRYTDLASELGVQEADAIMSTMENRRNKYGTIKDAILAPSQYSTWNTDTATMTAIENYKKNPSLYDSLVDNYVKDPKKNQGYTSYYNPSLASPDWGAKLQGMTDIGPHRFGTLGDYKNAFGQNFSGTQATQLSNTGPTQAGLGTGGSASARVSLSTDANRPSFSSGFTSRGMASDENANRSTTSASRESRDRTSGLSSSASTSRSTSEDRSRGSYGSSGRSGYSSIGSGSGFSSAKSSSEGRGSYGSSGRSGYSSIGSSSGFSSKGSSSSSSKSTRDASQPGGRVDRDEKGWK